MILIIDDDSAVRSSLSFMLKRAGYEVKTAPSPREAMDIVRAEAPALILMDMNFTLSTTGEEGLTLLKQVKVFRPDVPVILMTAWGSIQLAVQGMQAGAFDFITKPWNNAALLQRIETALELTAAPKEVPEEQTTALNRSHIIGKSKGLMEVLNTVARIGADYGRKRNGQGADCRSHPYQQPTCEAAFCQGESRRHLAELVRERDVRP